MQLNLIINSLTNEHGTVTTTGAGEDSTINRIARRKSALFFLCKSRRTSRSHNDLSSICEHSLWAETSPTELLQSRFPFASCPTSKLLLRCESNVVQTVYDPRPVASALQPSVKIMYVNKLTLLVIDWNDLSCWFNGSVFSLMAAKSPSHPPAFLFSCCVPVMLAG
jgi:hypothetical protein